MTSHYEQRRLARLRAENAIAAGRNPTKLEQERRVLDVRRLSRGGTPALAAQPVPHGLRLNEAPALISNPSLAGPDNLTTVPTTRPPRVIPTALGEGVVGPPLRPGLGLIEQDQTVWAGGAPPWVFDERLGGPNPDHPARPPGWLPEKPSVKNPFDGDDRVTTPVMPPGWDQPPPPKSPARLLPASTPSSILRQLQQRFGLPTGYGVTWKPQQQVPLVENVNLAVEGNALIGRRRRSGTIQFVIPVVHAGQQGFATAPIPLPLGS